MRAGCEVIVELQGRVLRECAGPGPGAEALRATNLAARADSLAVAFMSPGLTSYPDAGPAAALLAFVDECADDEHTALWVRSQLAEFGVSSEDLRGGAGGVRGTMPAVAGFRDRGEYDWVRVQDLPAPHNPFRCGYVGRYERFYRGERRRGRLFPWVDAHDNAARARAGVRFRRWLEGSDQPLCPWHDGGRDWPVVMSWVGRVWAATEDDWSRPGVERFIEVNVPADQAKAVRSVFLDPIVWGRGSNWLGSGQHRALALWRSGVDQVLVVR